MNIPKIELTKDEMFTAMEKYLQTCGINLQVVEVDTIGYPVKGFSVVCCQRTPPQSEPPCHEVPVEVDIKLQPKVPVLMEGAQRFA